MAQAAVGYVITVVTTGINLVNRNADIDEKRSQFTQKTTEELMKLGVNAACICTPHRAAGWTTHETTEYEGSTYHIYTAPKDTTFAIENLGDGGYINWCIRGTHWVRWGAVCHFHGEWNSGMGAEYSTRNSAYPHRQWLLDAAWLIK